MKSRTCWPRIFNSSSLQVSATCQEETLWISSWIRSRQFDASQSWRTVVGSRLVPFRRPWLWPRFAALRTSCRSFAPMSGRSRIIWVVLQDSWGRQKQFMVQAAIVCRVKDSVLQLSFSSTTTSGKLVASLEDSVVRSLAFVAACVVPLHVAQGVACSE